MGDVTKRYPDTRLVRVVYLRVPAATKSAWQVAAESSGLTLSAWMRTTLNAASESETKR